ncbi:hypothetical protein Lal_00006262 [Lupinus albus]|uniref:Putative transcription factor MYB-HB-like family n=1 Tax=Lupinus albus TaxID=3870 RepID=A0A6A4Q6P7_LUPAL|nr:putative transcription factor MYB-HB-like family [Lupinus albus]KAF1875632.1 hypothetical protein Lal_00006262 [Lupinus albus]
MGRPPNYEKIGIKKGPWTPEEDILLVSYIQEHGPGNWRSVPTNTGLMRCSKSCRLRWTNYLRPGIKRGNFTDHEEKMIIHLQALLGNRWAAIASYLPQRTDNDIKNYWNTHLRKNHNKLQNGGNDHNQEGHSSSSSSAQEQSKGQWERRLQTDIQMAKQALSEALSFHKPTTNTFPETKPLTFHIHTTTTSTYPTNQPNNAPSYASSYENISKLLKNWMMKSPNTPNSFSNNMVTTGSCSSEGGNSTTDQCTQDHAFDSLLSFNSSKFVVEEIKNTLTTNKTGVFQDLRKTNMETQQVPFTLLENWLFDDGAVQCHDDLMNMSLEESTLGLF